MTIPAEIAPVWFLEFDLRRLDEEIDRIREHIREIKLQGQESTEQSSESWHDNYNFEESQRQLRMFLNHLGGLSKARERAQLVEPPENPNVVTIGVTVTFRDRQTGMVDTFSIGSYTVSNELREHDFISYESPIALALQRLEVGHVRTARVGDRDRTYEVLSISSAAPLLALATERYEAVVEGQHTGDVDPQSH
jgi:transcription elongation GreA/GreB family factor